MLTQVTEPEVTEEDKENMKNSIVAYHGGGYDGCIYEWNYSLFTEDEEYIPIICTGSLGREDFKGFKRWAMDKKSTEYYDLDDPEALKEFGERESVHNIQTVDQWLRDNPHLHDDLQIPVACDECGHESRASYMIGIRAVCTGGVHIENKEIVCEDCYGLGSCRYCGDFFGREEINENGFCEFCQEETEGDSCG